MEFRSGWWVDASVGTVEDGFSVHPFQAPVVFVEEPVVVPAQQDQIVQVGGPTVGPMFDVVAVDVADPSTSGELTATVPGPELTTQPAGNGPGPAADAEDLTVVVDRGLHDRITRQPACRLIGEDRSRFQFGDPTGTGFGATLRGPR